MDITRRLARLVSWRTSSYAQRNRMFELGLGSSKTSPSESSDSSTSSVRIVPPNIVPNKLNSVRAYEPEEGERITKEYIAYRLWLHQQGLSTRE